MKEEKLMNRFYIKCSCGTGSKATWYFQFGGIAMAAAKMHSMLGHTTQVRDIQTDECVAEFKDGMSKLTIREQKLLGLEEPKH